MTETYILRKYIAWVAYNYDIYFFITDGDAVMSVVIHILYKEGSSAYQPVMNCHDFISGIISGFMIT